MRSFVVIFLALFTLLSVYSAEPTAMRTIEKGGFSGLQSATNIVVTNATQWTDIWKTHSAQKRPAAPAPEVNFEKETVLIVALGRKPTGGHAVEIKSVQPSGNKVLVTATTRAPRPGGVSIQALTAPFHIVAVPKLTGEVQFKIENEPERSK